MNELRQILVFMYDRKISLKFLAIRSNDRDGEMYFQGQEDLLDCLFDIIADLRAADYDITPARQ